MCYHCRISPPRFLAECRKRWLNQGSFVLLFFRLFVWFVFSFCMFIFLYRICIEFPYVYFPVLLCLSVSVKWLAVKTASEMTYIVSGGALNSTHSLTHSLTHQVIKYYWKNTRAPLSLLCCYRLVSIWGWIICRRKKWTSMSSVSVSPYRPLHCVWVRQCSGSGRLDFHVGLYK